MVQSISRQIEIASSPEHVREVFLDFGRMSEYTQGFIKSITPAEQKPAKQITKGDKLKVVLEGVTFSPSVLENTERQFMWRGTIPALLCGDHYFRFEPSKTTPGGTTFTQGEDFSGVLSFLMGMSMGQKSEQGFGGFNEDLKKRVESLK
ncbi:hypothetical protein LTR37_006145 [Vermiconidia calcicola]|uniref:Uncharacterized protein n=1 Tax=Vermiconidia calcicola TaxID=1690605 RepID=A0ACC3NGQ9_9PEZI|nr:hypothetical protein LTR37_006145 [Vermiconidia calcicola]